MNDHGGRSPLKFFCSNFDARNKNADAAQTRVGHQQLTDETSLGTIG